MRVGLGLRSRHALDLALDAHLAPEHRPVEQQRRVGVCLELVGLAAGVVREEDDAALVEPLGQDHPRRRPPIRPGGGERGGVGLEGARGARLVEPAPEHRQGVGVEVGLGERAVLAHGAAA
jgi:hypothetical protein